MSQRFRVRFNFSCKGQFNICKSIIIEVDDYEDFEDEMRLQIYSACGFRVKEYPQSSVLTIYSIKTLF